MIYVIMVNEPFIGGAAYLNFHTDGETG